MIKINKSGTAMSKENKFWDWFFKNNGRYYSLNLVADKYLKEKLLNELLEHLHNYSEGLYFEIGGSPNEAQELIISAEGKKEHFVEVEKLVAEVPLISNWKFVAFKQPATTLFVTEYEGLILDPKLIWFLPLDNENDPSTLGLIVYLKNYTERHKDLFVAGVFKVLDTLLGDKSAALNIQYLDVDKLPANPKKKGLIELVDLPKYISWRNKETSS